MLKLPDWFDDYRPSQVDAITRTLDGLDSSDVVMLDAPTGSGKTVIAESIRQHLGAERTLYLAPSKSLQDQFITDFAYARIIKGRDNYPTYDFPERFRSTVDNLTAGDCTKAKRTLPACGSCPDDIYNSPSADATEDYHCHWCHPTFMCPYEQAKADATTANLAVANISYFLAECNKGPKKFSGADLVIIDEADKLESELLGFIEVGISARRRKRWDLEPPDRKTVSEAWGPWVRDIALPRLTTLLAQLPRSDDLSVLRERRALSETIAGLKGIDFDSGNWVYTGYDRDDIRFRPIKVAEQAPDLLWAHGRRFLLMSATIISPAQFATDLGLPDYRYVAMPSTFPLERRPVVIRPRADMSRSPRRPGDQKGKRLDEDERATRVTEEREALAAELERILDTHPTERILVHTVSYDLTRWLLGRLDNPRTLAYNSAHDRDDALARFRANDGAVLLAPSLDRGIDLPYDACRVVVVAKIPFPDLSDRQIAARLRDGSWYAVQTVRTIVQMVGRGMRAPDDECTTYILDKQFTQNLWKRSSHLFPKWFSEAIDWTGGQRSLGGEAA